MAETKLLLLPLALFILGVAHGSPRLQSKRVLHLQKLQWEQHNTIRSDLRYSRSKKGSIVLEMKHRDVHQNDKLQKRLIFDDRRVRFLQSRFRNMILHKTGDVSDAQIPLTSGVRLQTLNYVVNVELGGRNMTVIVDTGSDLTWVQCQPCELCYNQQEPLFSPSSSPSYQTVPCNSSACQSLEEATGNSGVCGGGSAQTCNYVVNYGDGSYTRGDLGRERLNLGGSNVVESFVFGCGRNNKGLFGGASGLMGLGMSNLSLVSQTSSLFGGVFSYCLPATASGGSGSLVLGGDFSVYRNSTPVAYTRLVPVPELSSFYFLNLTGVTIGGVALHAPGFGRKILVDSGTVITRLVPSVYKAVKAEFLKQFSGFPQAPGYSILDTCFNFSAYQEVDIPTIKLQFEGNVELSVDVTATFYFVKADASQVCLALASLSYEDGIGIVGNYQQRNQRIIYDIKAYKMGFAGENCSFT